MKMATLSIPKKLFVCVCATFDGSPGKLSPHHLSPPFHPEQSENPNFQGAANNPNFGGKLSRKIATFPLQHTHRYTHSHTFNSFFFLTFLYLSTYFPTYLAIF
jgi:hypothetical protein